MFPLWDEMRMNELTDPVVFRSSHMPRSHQKWRYAKLGCRRRPDDEKHLFISYSHIGRNGKGRLLCLLLFLRQNVKG